ncbi:hypothetical protein RB597_000574 [Gaeumannomyces tritici]
MSDPGQDFAQFAQLADRVNILEEAYQAEKRGKDAPFQKKQNELEMELQRLEMELQMLKQNREAAGKEVDQKYKHRLRELGSSHDLTWLSSQPHPDQTTNSPASSNVGPSVREEGNNRDRLATDDGSEDGDGGLGDGGDKPVDGELEPADSNNKPGHSDSESSNDDRSDYSDAEPVDDDDRSDQGGSESDSDNHDGSVSATFNSPRVLRKRKPTKAESDLESPKKRNRRDRRAAGSGGVEAGVVGAARDDGTEKTISLEDIFGRYRIIPWPAASHRFYILRCDHHGKIFNSKDAAQGAGKHLSKVHGTAGTHENAINELGFRVQNCTQEQVNESNRAVEQLDNAVRRPRRLTSDPKTSIQPVSGVFYQVYWPTGGKSRSSTRSGTPFIALCLPTDGFDEVGISGSIHDTDLMRHVPMCYRTHTRTKKILGWDEDHQDGGTKASQRKFPFLFFTSDLRLPSEGKLSIPKKGKMFSWVAANKIQPLDLNDSTTSHLPGHATAIAFASRLPQQHESAAAINNQSSATKSGPRSDARDNDGSGDGNGAEGSRAEALAQIASAGLSASSAEAGKGSADAEQPADDTSQSAPKPTPSDRAEDSGSSAQATLDSTVQRTCSQLPDEDADTAQNGPTLATHVPSNSEDSRPGFEGTRASSNNNRPSSEENTPKFENSRPRPEDGRQDTGAEAVVGAPQSKPVSDAQGRDSRAGRGSLGFILETSHMEDYRFL